VENDPAVIINDIVKTGLADPLFPELINIIPVFSHKVLYGHEIRTDIAAINNHPGCTPCQKKQEYDAEQRRPWPDREKHVYTSFLFNRRR
jgi:hypothetical protein